MDTCAAWSDERPRPRVILRIHSVVIFDEGVRWEREATAMAWLWTQVAEAALAAQIERLDRELHQARVLERHVGRGPWVW